MKFGDVPVAEAAGAILAHSARLTGRVLKKGRVLSADDLSLLVEAGIETVVAARLEEGDIGEDEAAALLAAALAGDGARVGKAFTGRCNLFAENDGVCVIDRARLARLNMVDEAITLATVTPYEAVVAEQMLATVKIIPFAVPRAALDACRAIIAEAGPLISVAPFLAKDVGLILTRLPGMKERLLDTTATTLGARLERFGSRVAWETRCAHDQAEVQNAITAMLDRQCELILIFGASATVDRRDTLPAAVVAAGGRIDHFGMPVDPGNLLFLGHQDRATVVGMPGCARSPKINGFDWVLWRLLADLEVGPEDIMAMGVGGLLKEMTGRPQPRRGDADSGADTGPARAPKIAALVLAAGASTRMGDVNKLLANVDGIPMVVRVVDAVMDSGASSVVVVTGHQADEVAAAFDEDRVDCVHNPEFSQGMSTSLRTGLKALPGDIDGVVVCLGDMPRVTADHIDKLIAAFDPVEGRSICVPVRGRKRGNPILWGKDYFAEMAAVSGDVGARHLLEEHADDIYEVAITDDGVLTDIDTPERLEQLAGQAAKTSQ